MTPAEIRATLAMAKHTADALALRSQRPLHDGFAVEALDAFAEAGRLCCCPSVR